MELTKAEIKLLRKAYSVMADTHRKYHPESEKDISEFENKFEPIPSDYRYLLKEFGGCHFVDPWIFTLEELDCEYPAFIANYTDDEESNISNNTVFPIGGLGDGSLVCILKETDKIVVLPHDVYVTSVDDLEIIAESFKELVFGLAEQGIELDNQIKQPIMDIREVLIDIMCTC